MIDYIIRENPKKTERKRGRKKERKRKRKRERERERVENCLDIQVRERK